MSAWLLPDHIADVLPAEALHIETLRRQLLDLAGRYGYAQVMPPMVEHLQSLLVGAGEALALQTFNLVDQLSGRTLGLRADTTPQVARIDAHLLARDGVTRLTYCGPVVHTRPAGPNASREPLQLGAELYGHAGLEADLEILQLALEGLGAARLPAPVVDLADVRVVRALLAGVLADPQRLRDVHAALAIKDVAALRALTRDFPAAARAGLLALPSLYGDATVLAAAQQALPPLPAVQRALSELRWLGERLPALSPGVRLSYDLSDLGDYAYYCGARFAIYHDGASDALVRGGRYEAIGAAFDPSGAGERPAVGFSLDVKALARVAAPQPPRRAIRAPWLDDAALAGAIALLRAQGETVICTPANAAPEASASAVAVADRELVAEAGGRWVLRPL